MNFRKNIAIDQAVVALTSVASLYIVAQLFSLTVVGDVAYSLLICQLCASPLMGVLRYHATHNRINITKFGEIYNSFILIYFCLSLLIAVPVVLIHPKVSFSVILLYATLMIYSGVRITLFHRGSYSRLVHFDLSHAIILVFSILIFYLLSIHLDLIYCWIISYCLCSIFYGGVINLNFSKRSLVLMQLISFRYWIEAVSISFANARSFFLVSILYAFVGSESLGILRMVQAIFGWVGSISTVLETIIAKFLNRNDVKSSIRTIGLNTLGGLVFVVMFSLIVLYGYTEFYFLFDFLGQFSEELVTLIILQSVLSIVVIFNSSLFSVFRLHRMYVARLIGIIFEISVVFPMFIFLFDFNSAKMVTVYFIVSSVVVSLVSSSYVLVKRLM